jgi:F-type H+-transporting ATPase subunit gamma
MANPLELRRRIRSVDNTRQITRAMQLVAASRMRRAQEAVEAARPYDEAIVGMIRRLVEASSSEQLPALLRPRPIKRTAFVVLTTNRGLAGPLNTNTVRHALENITTAQTYAEVSVIVVGRKGDIALRNVTPVLAAFTAVSDRPKVEDILPLAQLVTDGFEAGEFDEVQLVYPQFINTLIQRPTAVRLLPVVVPEDAEARRVEREVIFEPEPESVLSALLPRFVETVLYQALLELTASEHSARMVAMRNATENASELIEALRLAYNKLRQSRITSEIIDIAAGASALAEQA